LRRQRLTCIFPLVCLALLLLPALLSPNVGGVEPNQICTSSLVATVMGPRIIFEETSDYVKLDFAMFTVEFYKGTAGYNKIYDRFGNVLVYDDRIVLEYWTGKQWKQRGTPIDISWKKISDYHYEVTRFYDDYAGTKYNVTYTVKSDSPMKITISLKSGRTDEYRIAWYLSGITYTKWKKHGDRMIFGDEAGPYGWIGFDWSDVYQSLGNITETSCEDVANGKKANIYFNVGGVEEVTIDPSVIGPAAYGAIDYVFQRKMFYAEGRYWIFYGDGDNIVYRSSIDGITWSDATILKSGYGYGNQISVWFDGTYVHYAFATGEPNTPLYYRRGDPNPDGTISWNSEQIAVPATEDRYYFPCISVDSNGYPWIGYQLYDVSASSQIPYVTKSSRNDGVWSTASGFPYALGTGKFVAPIPLTSGKMLVIYTGVTTLHSRYWSGSWGTERSITCTISEHWSAVAEGDNVHIAYWDNGPKNIYYAEYSYASDSWSTPLLLQEGGGTISEPAVSKDPNINALFVFWGFYPSSYTYYLKKDLSTGQWDSSPTQWLTEVQTSYICFYEAYNNKIGVAWLYGDELHFAVLSTVNQAPNAPTLNSPAENARFNPSASVQFSWTFSDPDSGDSQSAYQFQLDDNSDFSSPIIDTGKVASSTSSTTQTLPSTVGLYYWRVKTWDSQDAEGAWSTGRAIIVDRVQVTLSVADSRIDVGSAMSWSFTAVYEYDGADATPYVTVSLNDTTTKTSVGKWAFTVSSITESQYGLTEFTSNIIECIWDRVQITLSVSDTRIDVGSTMLWSFTATYEYDGSDAAPYVAVTLNDTTTKTSVGKWAFTVSSITDTQYGLTVFESNTIECVWDRVNITAFSAVDNTIKVGEEAQFIIEGVYEYDNAVWSGSYSLNDTLSHSAIGKYGYRITSITDDNYDLTAFIQTAPDPYILVGFNSTDLFNLNNQYRSEGKPYIQNTTHMITALTFTPKTLTFKVEEIPAGETSITTVKGIWLMPTNVYIDGSTVNPKSTKEEFDSYGGKCWYYDSANDLIYIKTTGSLIEILWEGYTPPPPAPPVTPAPPPTTYGLVVTVTSMGRPVPDLKVEVYSDSTLVASGTTDQQGIYSVSLPPGTYRVVVYLDKEKITETVTLNEPKTLTITVPAAPTIEITRFIGLAAILTILLILLTAIANYIRKR